MPLLPSNARNAMLTFQSIFSWYVKLRKNAYSIYLLLSKLNLL